MSMPLKSYAEVLRELCLMRKRLNSRAFNDARGYSAAFALIASERFGGELASVVEDGTEHWFNRIPCLQGVFEFDAAGDELGRLPVTMGRVDELYANALPRRADELDLVARERARWLTERLREQVAA